jgi:hypothetical protein
MNQQDSLAFQTPTRALAFPGAMAVVFVVAILVIP